MARYESVLESVGGTPLIRVTRATEGLRPRIYVKAEWQNPGGSVKDRAAVAMLRRAEADGSLRPGGTVVEVTSGNTGIGLALAAAYLGYRSVIFTNSSIAQEKQSQLAAYGAELRLVDTFVPKPHPDSLRSNAERYVAETPGAWLAAQYDNPANPEAHYASTGPEIWTDTDGTITHFVATVGTGGTISGAGRYLKEVSDGRVRVVGADPITSAYSGGDGSQKYIEGAGHFVHPDTTIDEWPAAFDVGVVDDYIGIDDQRAIDVIRLLARTDGILAGGSSGVALAAAFQIGEDLTEDDTIVVLLPDSGRTYLSTYFNDNWLSSNGFTVAAAHGRKNDSAVSTVGDRAIMAPLIERDDDAAEVIARLAADGLGDDDMILVAYPRAGRALAPHPSDIVGWTTLTRLVGAATVADTVQPAVRRLGTGLALTNPAVAAWDGSDGGVALVLDQGRVTGIVTREVLGHEPAHAVADEVG